MSLDNYVDLIRDHDQLSKAEQIRLGRKARQGDEQAKQRLVETNLELVLKIANEYRHVPNDLDDLVQAGNEGLMVAVNKFDPERETKFTSFASHWIRIEIKNEITKHSSTIRTPAYIQHTQSRIHGYKEEHGSDVSMEELAKGLDVPIKWIKRALSRPVTERLEGKHVSEGAIERDALKEIMVEGLEDLPPEERRILKKRFGLNGDAKTLEEIGDMINCSNTWAKVEIEGLLKKLKSKVNEAQKPS